MAKRYYVEDDDSDSAVGVLVLIVLAIAFLISPGIIVTSLLRFLIDLSVSQCWGCSIVTCLVLCTCLHFFTETGLTFRKYAICVLCSGLFILLFTLFINDNCFYNTLIYMFEGLS